MDAASCVKLRSDIPTFPEAAAKSLLWRDAALPTVVGMATRYFFHLVDSRNVIRDDLGALASDLGDAYRAAAEILEEFRAEQASRFDEWKDWRLIVTEESSNFALVIPLSPDAPAPIQPRD